MSKFKVSNKLFEIGLTACEMAVYVYLCSIFSVRYTLDNQKVVKVRQSVIAEKCGIKSTQTVAKTIIRLKEKGLVEKFARVLRFDGTGFCGTNLYAVTELPMNEGFFFADRQRVFSELIPRQIMVFLFICKAYSYQINDSWNSYNDIVNQTGLSRSTVIKTIKELVKKNYIIKRIKKAKNNDNVYIDNHYHPIIIIKLHIKKKMTRLHLLLRSHIIIPSTNINNNIINKAKSQHFSIKKAGNDCFSIRGST